MKKPKLYVKAVEWIAENDESAETQASVMENLISVALVADLFGHTALYVANDVVRLRHDERAKRPAGLAGVNWSAWKYPGDTVRIAAFIKDKTVGDVRIQVYTETSVRVGCFLPGVDVFLPGDTPKVEPEQSTWVKTRDAADAAFDAYVIAAKEDGWSLHAAG